MVKKMGDGIPSQTSPGRETEPTLHLTSQGRNLLRDAFVRFLDRMPFGLRKISSIIADENKSAQDEEDDRTRSALKRWAFEGQPQLWKKDAVKSQRVLARLEALMMSFDDVAAGLTLRKETAELSPLNEGLQAFFGVTDSRVSPPIQPGLYNERRATHGMEDDDGLSIHFSYCYFRPDDTGTALLTDTFNLIAREGEPPVLERWMSGISYFTKQGTLMRFLVSQEDTRRRRIDTLHKVEWSRRYMSFAPIDAPVFISRRDELGIEDDELDFTDLWVREHGNLVITALVRNDARLPILRQLIG